MRPGSIRIYRNKLFGLTLFGEDGARVNRSFLLHPDLSQFAASGRPPRMSWQSRI
jgi:hypothetical protein